MKIRDTSNAPGYVRKFQRAIVASAIATFLGACAGSTSDETGNGAAIGTRPEIGAAVEASVGTNTDLVIPGNGSGVEVTPDTDSAGVDSEVDVSEGVQTDIEVDSSTDTVEIPEVDSTNSIPDNALALIQSHPELNLFATAIQSTELVAYLADPEQRVTVFALSDKAFESLSSIQRDALFNDPTRLETLVRSSTIPDRIPESAAGVVGNLDALANGTLRFEREGELILVAVPSSPDAISPPVYSIEVTDSLANDEAAIHIIDDFINIGTTFFPPDPGSIMDRLLTDESSTISNRIRYTRWYRELGNSESEWTVFAPLVSVNTYDIEPYIVAGTVNDPIIGEAGAFTSVDGSSHVIENVDGALTIDDIDISEINAHQVNNGHVHRIAWPLGEVPVAYDVIVNSTNHSKLAWLIDRANLDVKLGDAEYTIFAPTDAAFAAFESAAPGMLENMSAADLQRILQYHVVEGTLTTTSISNGIAISEAGFSLTQATLLTDTSLTFSTSETSSTGLSVTGNADLSVDLDYEILPAGEYGRGAVFSINTVLTTPAVYQDYDSDGISDADDTDADGDGLDDFDGEDKFVDLNRDGLDDKTMQTEAEANAGTVNEVSARFPCGSERGGDNSSVNNAWNDNCIVRRPSNGGQFSDSLFTVGIQRVLYCSGFGSGMDYTVFANGEFGPATEAATIAFQEAESLTTDGMVGPQTWERLQERIELLTPGILNQTPDTYGFTEGVCADIPMFYQEIFYSNDSLNVIRGGWTLARNQPNEAQSVPFSYELPFGRL